MSTLKLPVPVEWAARLVRKFPTGRNRVLSRLVPAPPGTPFIARLPNSRTGLRYECDKENALAWAVFCSGAYEIRETELLRSLMRPGDTFVDIGANWGYFTLLGAEEVGPSGRVVAIEADPRNHAILERNITQNHLMQVTLVHAAAAAAEGKVTLVGFDGQQNHGVSHVKGTSQVGVGRLTKSDAPLIEVRANAVDDLLDGVGVGRVDLVKMDIEGAEALALPGMRGGLAAGRYRRIVLEVHAAVLGEYGTDAKSLLAMLTDAGYRIWLIEPDGLRLLDDSVTTPDRYEILAAAPGEDALV